MNTIFVLLQFFLMPHNNLYSEIKDSCKLFSVPVSTPFREISMYREYYERFSNNDTSEYQVIAISIPYDDSYGHVLYYETRDSVRTSEVGATPSIKKKEFSKSENAFFYNLLNKVEIGGYGCICDMDAHTIIYSVCIIKRKKDILFQYQAINKNIITLKGDDGEKLKNIIKLLRALREG